MPSSRAAFLISEDGRRARIISRMLSDRSSSSQMAVRPLNPVPPHSMQPAPSKKQPACSSVRIERRLDQLLPRDRRRPLAVDADVPHQPLRQHAVERRHELVGLDAHVQEAAEHVEDVVGVDGREHEVPGQRRLDGDLRRLADRGSRRP